MFPFLFAREAPQCQVHYLGDIIPEGDLPEWDRPGRFVERVCRKDISIWLYFCQAGRKELQHLN
jgi:hypothetical protein